MLKSDLKIAAKVFQRNKLNTLVNILGLVIGFVISILATLFSKHELTYDSWLPDSELLYRYEVSFGETIETLDHYSTSHPAVRELLLETFPQIESAVRIFETQLIVETLDKRKFQYNVRYVDTNFFEVFDLPMILGEKSTALITNNSMMISESTAQRLFGDGNPIGKILNTNNMRNSDNDFSKQRSEDNQLMQRDYVVTGVFKDIPTNSHLVLDIIAPFEATDPFPRYYGNWAYNHGNVYTYLKLKSVEDRNTISARLPTFVDKYLPLPVNQPDLMASDLHKPKLVNITDIHFLSTGLNSIKKPGDITQVYVSISIATLILAIAVTNSANIGFAQSTLRSKEVAVKKIMGASNLRIAFQFIFESILLAFVSLFLAIVCLDILMPIINNYIGTKITYSFSSDTEISIIIIVLTCLVGVIGGGYPAFIVSRYRPAKILKSEQSSMTRGGSVLRVGSVSLQFFIASTLGIVAIIMIQQIDFIQNRNLGFSIENRIVVDDINEPAFMQFSDQIAREIRRLPGVKSATLSRTVPLDDLVIRRGAASVVANPEQKLSSNSVTLSVDHHFLQSYEIKLLAGRYFSEDFAQDWFRPPVDFSEEIPLFSIILNEASIRQMGFDRPESAVGVLLEGGRVAVGELR